MEFRSWVVRGGGRRFLCTYDTTIQYSTVLLYMCSKQKHKADHGHKKGPAPRELQGHLYTGISRPLTEVLRTRTSSPPQQTHCSETVHRAGTCIFTIMLLQDDVAR